MMYQEIPYSKNVELHRVLQRGETQWQRKNSVVRLAERILTGNRLWLNAACATGLIVKNASTKGDIVFPVRRAKNNCIYKFAFEPGSGGVRCA
jgi:outer membrane protein assembly factor BamB